VLLADEVVEDAVALDDDALDDTSDDVLEASVEDDDVGPEPPCPPGSTPPQPVSPTEVRAMSRVVRMDVRQHATGRCRAVKPLHRRAAGEGGTLWIAETPLQPATKPP
jgi:hypothetical protein